MAEPKFANRNDSKLINNPGTSEICNLSGRLNHQGTFIGLSKYGLTNLLLALTSRLCFPGNHLLMR